MTDSTLTPSQDAREAALKLCPFCADEPSLAPCAETDDTEPEDRGVISWGISCSCTAFVGPWATEAEAIAAWNTRAEPDEQAIRRDEAGKCDFPWPDFERTVAALDSLYRNLGAASLARNPLGMAVRDEAEIALRHALSAIRARHAETEKIGE